MPVNCTRLKPETLLRRLASDKNVKDSVRLRAIELLILLEKQITVGQPIRQPKEPSQSELTSLTQLQSIEPFQVNAQAPIELREARTELSLSAAR